MEEQKRSVQNDSTFLESDNDEPTPLDSRNIRVVGKNNNQDDDNDVFSEPIKPPRRHVKKKDSKQKKKQHNEEPSSDDDDDLKYDFSDLTDNMVRINLRLIGDLTDGEKITITDDDKKMQIEKRIFSSVRRYFSEDSRVKTVHFIRHVIRWTRYYAKNYINNIRKGQKVQYYMEKLTSIHGLLQSSIKGLTRLQVTYADDKHNGATIDQIVSDIRVFCNEQLKSALEKYNVPIAAVNQ